MIVKNILDEELLTIPEVKEVLDHIREERADRDEKLGYELSKAINHTDMFAKTSSEKSRELVNRLVTLEKMKPEIAVRIADIMPLSRDELRAIYTKERYTLLEQELDEMLEMVLDAME